jgi:hypothetical protein
MFHLHEIGGIKEVAKAYATHFPAPWQLKLKP